VARVRRQQAAHAVARDLGPPHVRLAPAGFSQNLIGFRGSDQVTCPRAWLCKMSACGSKTASVP